MSYLDVVSPLRRNQYSEMDQITRRMLNREQPPPKIPDFAQSMSPKAKAIFDECYKSRPYYTWNPADLALLSDYANVVVELHEELERYREEGAVIYAGPNAIPRQNPRRGVISTIRQEIHRLIKELNLSPGYMMRLSLREVQHQVKESEKANNTVNDIESSDGLLAEPIVLDS